MAGPRRPALASRKPARCPRAPAGRPARDPGYETAAEADKQQCRSDPEECRRQEHVDGKGERRVRIWVDDGREAGPRSQPVDEARNREREQIEIEPLPERPPRPADAAARVTDAAPERGQSRSDPRSQGST